MATEKLKILLDADWKGKSEVQQANKDINKLDDGVGDTQASLGRFAVGAGIAVGALVAVGTAAKVAWDALSEGASLLRTQDQFERLALSIGSTADAMLGKLKDATSGLVSDAQLVESAGQIISLGLAKTEGDVVRLANLVTQLGWDMQQVILTFANNSKARLDSLGLSVEDVESKMVALEAQGYSTDQAFDLAVIEAGEEKLELLGSAAGTLEGQLQTLQTAWENMRNSMVTEFASGVTGQLNAVEGQVGDLALALQPLAEMLNFIAGIGGGVVGSLAANQLEFNQMVADMERVQAGGIFGGQGNLLATEETRSLKEYNAEMVKSAAIVTTQTEAEQRNLYLAEQRTQGLKEGAAAQRDATMTTIAEQQAADDLKNSIGGVGIAAISAADEMAALARETGNFFDQARRSDDFDPAEVFYQSALAAGASAAQLQQLLVGTGLETPERAQEIYNESIQRQLASQAGSAFAGGGNLDMLWQGVQAGVANPQFAAQQVANTTNVGGVSVSIVINGDITGEDLDMTVDNAVASTEAAYGATPGG